MKIPPTTPHNAMQLCDELAATGRLSNADSELLLATVQHYQLDHTAPGDDWRKSFATLADAQALREHFAQSGRGRHRERDKRND